MFSPASAVSFCPSGFNLNAVLSGCVPVGVFQEITIYSLDLRFYSVPNLP